jgi:AcrR family transcriptional regulator
MAEVVPPYRRIVADVRRRIETGQLRQGDRIPSVRAITRQWGVAIATATKVHAVLREEGLTIARPGVGTVVAGPARRSDHELTRARIVSTAIAIADTDGLAELSMRRIATALGAATMSLYRYVQSRDDLMLAMIDTTLGELRLPMPHPARWRDSLEICARLEWALFQRHPWLGPSMSLARPQLVPNAMRLSEWVMAAFDRTPVPLDQRMYIQILLFTFVRGLASALEPEIDAVRDSGLTADEWMASQAATISRLIKTDGMSHFQQLATLDFDFNLDKLFEFGLTRLLDGIDLLVSAQPGSLR